MEKQLISLYFIEALEFFKTNQILIDSKHYKGDNSNHSHLKDCDYFFDIMKKDLDKIKLPNESNKLDLGYDYRNFESKPELENQKLTRIYFKI